jgi:hypothetical protein
MHHPQPIYLHNSQDRANVMRNWAWFRQQIAQIYDITDLPPTFTENEGEISQNQRITDEDSIDYMLCAPEYNYSWWSQRLTWTKGDYTISAIVNQDEHQYYHSFSVKGLKQSVDIFVGSYKTKIEIDDESPQYAAWIAACDKLPMN